MISEHPCASLESAAAALAEALADALRQALATRRQASLLVSGGRTPRLVLPRLSAADLDWSRVVVSLTDERWVPPDHADSNEGLARRELLRGAAALPRPVDAVFLGMGEDGHVASLFPDDPDWASAAGPLHATAGTPQRQARISLTMAALLDARHLLLCVSGREKTRRYHSVRAAPDPSLPIARILHQDRVPVSVFISD